MGWRLIRTWTLLVYLFMFLPVAVVVLLSFNASQFGSFPMTGFSSAGSWSWRERGDPAGLPHLDHPRADDRRDLDHARCAGEPGAGALPGSRANLITTLLIAPILVPEVVLAVALLLFLNFLEVGKSFTLLLAGHVIFTLPFVILVVQARLVASSATSRRRR
jgi:spermidine/putrescine transport system permease protein